MHLLAHCITWNRPDLLGRSIHCFLQQTDPNARLIVLDDAGQYVSETHERWALISVSKRYPTMGDKRNAAIKIGLGLYPDTDAVMLWDDDDCYFPHTAESVCEALDKKEWAQPRKAFELEPDGKHLRRVETYNRHAPKLDTRRMPAHMRRAIQMQDRRTKTYGTLAYGGCWAFRLREFERAGMFATTSSSEDTKLAYIFRKSFGDSADSSPDEPWYYYNRLNNSISAEAAGGRDFYELRGRQDVEFAGRPNIGWNGPDMFALPILPGVFPRPW